MGSVASLAQRVEQAVGTAIGAVLPDRRDADPLVRRSDRPGVDVQSNAALSLAGAAHRSPAQLAGQLADRLGGVATGLPGAVSVTGPGFLNVRFDDAALWGQVAARLADDRLGVGTPQAGVRAVVDYSSVNVAKQLHVGHLRSTVIGDALVRVLGFLGAEVIRENHLGDWGTQFGMLIQYLVEHPEAPWQHDRLAPGVTAVSALDALYRSARAAFDADPAFADRARRRVVALQSGDPDTLDRWRQIVTESQHAFQQVYDRLGVLLTEADAAGESRYNDALPGVVDELVRREIAVPSHGALCVFDPAFTGHDGAPVPLIVRKSDGGFGYAATDLATVRDRVDRRRVTRMLYVVDARQGLHFRQVFAAARRAGWLPDDVHAEHVAFGMVLGADGRPFRTRDGDTARLSDLLDEAVASARRVVLAKNPAISGAEADRIAELCGIAAVKYADLATSRQQDYRFDPDRMVSFTGNTGVYLLYAHTRVAAILRRAGAPGESAAAGAIGGSDRAGEPAAFPAPDPAVPVAPAERALILALDGFGEVAADVAALLEPHRLCGYLYELARAFTAFYESCPVLAAEPPVRGNRLALCRLTRRTLAQGLALLGLPAPDRL
ncbi:arginine--tRNA ligase [Actinocatenispora thailandica]|uniref:Arginine--tRNA ligase n=1 Tax=Actinocatenispora thailandica TaxID=227318 RepID=A0A7R7DRH6_9ACTN|nr:arginine--tRNA ligase [Actinocatenispora thailandica]BCJ36447.1 arginine--tRNA ligase [Actinocatenispora thailandica]